MTIYKSSFNNKHADQGDLSVQDSGSRIEPSRGAYHGQTRSIAPSFSHVDPRNLVGPHMAYASFPRNHPSPSWPRGYGKPSKSHQRVSRGPSQTPRQIQTQNDRRELLQEASERARSSPEWRAYTDRIEDLKGSMERASKASKDRIQSTETTLHQLEIIYERDYILYRGIDPSGPSIDTPRAYSLVKSINELTNKATTEQSRERERSLEQSTTMKFLLGRRAKIGQGIEREFIKLTTDNRARDSLAAEERKEAIRRQQRIESKNLSTRGRIERSNRNQNEPHDERTRHREGESIEERMRTDRHRHYIQNVPEGFFQRPTLNDYRPVGRCCMIQEESKEPHPKFSLPRFISDNVFEWSKQVIISCNAQLPMASTVITHPRSDFVYQGEEEDQLRRRLLVGARETFVEPHPQAGEFVHGIHEAVALFSPATAAFEKWYDRYHYSRKMKYITANHQLFGALQISCNREPTVRQFIEKRYNDIEVHLRDRLDGRQLLIDIQRAFHTDTSHRISVLQSEFHDMSLGSMFDKRVIYTATELCTSLDKAGDELVRLGALEPGGLPHQLDQKLISRVLHGLLREPIYSALRESLESQYRNQVNLHAVPLTWTEVKDRCRLKDLDLKSLKGNSRESRSVKSTRQIAKTKFCDYCHKKFHTESECLLKKRDGTIDKDHPKAYPTSPSPHQGHYGPGTPAGRSTPGGRGHFRGRGRGSAQNRSWVNPHYRSPGSIKSAIPIDQVECFYCKKMGHYANECPNRKSGRASMIVPEENQRADTAMMLSTPNRIESSKSVADFPIDSEADDSDDDSLPDLISYSDESGDDSDDDSLPDLISYSDESEDDSDDDTDHHRLPKRIRAESGITKETPRRKDDDDDDEQPWTVQSTTLTRGNQQEYITYSIDYITEI